MPNPPKQPLKPPVLIPLLVRFWSEDGVWNASAMDIPVAVFGATIEEARAAFEEALKSHLEILREKNRLDRTIEHLLRIAEDPGSYQRIPPHQIFEKLLIDTQRSSLLAV